MDKYVIYSPNYASFQPKTFDNEEEAYDYYESIMMKFLSKNECNGVRFVLLKNGKVIDSGGIIDVSVKEVIK